ncbi:MAG: 50S ribosomal protein L9 [Mogibacterium sp.]|nr:50S ribosomal protein L9 [Mogibacterium sp.]
MLVILKKDVKGTGKAGDVVKVSDGFANNRLIPAGLAVPATDKNIRSIEKQKAFLEQKNAEEKERAQKAAAKLEEKPVTIRTRVGSGGKLFGSITSMDIAEAIKDQLGKSIDKKKIVLAKPIKEIGETVVEVKLFPEVSAKLRVIVEEE